MRAPLRLFRGSVIVLLCLLCNGISAQVVTEFRVGISAGAKPYAITAGPDGNVWFLERGLHRVGRITTQGVITEFSAGISEGASLIDITAGPDGNLWFTEADGGDVGKRIGRISPSGVVTEFATGIGARASPFFITLGADGNLWFTEYFSEHIGRITPMGVITEFSTGISGDVLGGLASGPDGNLWFTVILGNRIGRITLTGVVTEFSVGISDGANLGSITPGPDGNLWFTEFFGNRIGRITPAGVVTEFSVGIGAVSGPDGITAGPDGNLWFTELSGRIGRITPSGVITEFSAGISVAASPADITAGPDGNLWFTESVGNRIGRITTSPGPSSTLAVEYRHATFDHYFITPVAAEIALLDARTPPFQEWSRTGYMFNVYAPATAPAGSVAICRFFNDHFAPKSSHFYAPHGLGCEETIAFFPDWLLEDDKLFNAMLPNPMGGACPAGTIPVYRLYNNGTGNAPNHRFVTSLAERQNMISSGWIAEGSGIGVGMCVPE